MAKVSFTKLNLKANNAVKAITWGDQEIEVKQYLSIKDKLELVANVINCAHDDNNFSNPLKLDMFTILEIFNFYTNINFTDKQREDAVKLYDLLVGSGLADAVMEALPDHEIDDLYDSILRTSKSIYGYRNSALGILEAMSDDYSNLNLDATEIQKKLADGENIEFLKEVMAKLG